MALNIFEAARVHKTTKLIAAGSICAYPKFAPIPFREADIWNGYPEETNAPYGLAKKNMIVQSSAYRDQYGLSSVVLFPVNLYGPRDNFDLETSHVILALIRKCVEARNKGIDTVTIWGDGSPTREFLYVQDAAEGLIAGAEKYDDSAPINLGSGEEMSIRALAEYIAEATGFLGAHLYGTKTNPTANHGAGWMYPGRKPLLDLKHKQALRTASKRPSHFSSRWKGREGWEPRKHS